MLCFATGKENKLEVLISNDVFKNTPHRSVNKYTTIQEAAPLIKEDILATEKHGRVEYRTNEFPDPVINKFQEPPKITKIKHSAYVPVKFSSLFLILCCFRNWNSHDQAIPTIS